MAEPATSIRDNPRPDLRRKLLDSAERMFSERAYDDVRVDDIAADAGVAKGLVYYHFENKRGIYAAVLQAMAEDVSSRTIPDPDLPPLERTAAVLDSFIEWAMTVERFTLAIARGPGADPVVTQIITETLDLHVDRMLDGMKEAAAELGIENTADSPAMRHAIKGWVVFTWTVTIDWLATKDLEPSDLRDLYLLALGGSITAGREINSRIDGR